MLPLHTVCNGSLFSFSQLLAPAQFVPFDERRLIACLLFSLFGPSLQFVGNSLREQLASLPSSIILCLDICFVAQAPGPVLACSLSWIDQSWVHQHYFLGLTSCSPVSHWTHISSSVAKLLTSVGVQMSDCCALISPKSSLIHKSSSFLHTPPCPCHIEDLFDSLMTLLAKALLNNETTLSHGIAPLDVDANDPSITLVQSLRRANSLIDFLNQSLKFPLSEDLSILQLERIDWDNLISVSSSLSRFMLLLSPFLHTSLSPDFSNSTPSSRIVPTSQILMVCVR